MFKFNIDLCEAETAQGKTILQHQIDATYHRIYE